MSCLTSLLHHNQIFDVILKTVIMKLKVIVMQRARGRSANLNWTCGQGKSRLYISVTVLQQLMKVF